MKTQAADYDDVRWKMVLERVTDPGQVFFYAAKTTGVFCRPSCSSRRPKRENVEFYRSVDDAQSHGFRACKRCKPDAPAAKGRALVLERACRRLETDEKEPTLTELAIDAAMSPFHFQRVFKAHVGLSPKAYAKAVRAQRLKQSLSGGGQVTDAIYAAGFAAPSRAYEAAKENMGMTPSSWRDGASGEAIGYALADCYLGRVIVAATARGICAIEFGDDDERLIATIGERFPQARITRADASFDIWLDTVVAFVAAPTDDLDLPLDIQGTAFQQRVWTALRQIPPGTTVSYGELAKKIGQPRAARAVARACASNKIAVAIPCHRVVRANGALSGYRWGPQRKRAILEREAEPSTTSEQLDAG